MTATSAIESGRQTLVTTPVAEQELPRERQQLGLTIRSAASLPIDLWPDERISAIRAYAGKEATTIGELAAFLAACQRYGLDPMVGQLFLIKTEAGPKVCAGRDTWLALARREQHYRGIAFGVVHEKDTFNFRRTEEGRVIVQHEVAGVKRGAIAGAFCTVRDDRLGENIEVRELADFAHLLNKFNWKNYKSDMLQNRCIAAVLRKHYGFPGLIIVGEDDELKDPPAIIEREPLPTGGAARLRAITGADSPVAPLVVSEVPEAVLEPEVPERMVKLLENADVPGALSQEEMEEVRQWKMDHPEQEQPKTDA